MIWSPTRAKAAARCPMEHHLRYVERIKSRPRWDHLRGLAAHRALEAAGRAALAGDSPRRAAAVSLGGDKFKVRAMVEAGLARGFDGLVAVERTLRGTIAGVAVTARADAVYADRIEEYKTGDDAGALDQAGILAQLSGLPVHVINLHRRTVDVVGAGGAGEYIDFAIAQAERGPVRIESDRCGRCVVKAACQSWRAQTPRAAQPARIVTAQPRLL